MFSFVKCPCCAGHEALSQKSIDALEGMLSIYLDMHPEATELYNILNAIRNIRQRQEDRKSAIANLLG